MTPIDLDDDDKGDWVIEARGRTFTPPRRTTLSPHAQAQRSMVYSPKRILHAAEARRLGPRGRAQHRRTAASPATSRSAGTRRSTSSPTRSIREKRENGPGSILTTCSSHHLWGNIGYRHSAYYRFLNLMGMAHCGPQPRQLGGLALGRHADVGQQPPPRHPRAVRPARGRAQAHRDGRLLVGRPGDHRRRHLLRLREHLAALLDEGARHQDGVRRSLLQPDRRALLRQVVRAAPGHRRRLRPRHRPHVARRGTLRQGVRRRAHHRLRRVEGLRPRQDATTCPRRRSGPRASAASPPAQIRALAREWGAKKTMLAAGGLGGWGGACRSATGNEWARTMVALAAMQGYGKPGSQHLGHLAGRARRTARSSSPATPRAASPATRRSRRPATACSTACSPHGTGLHPTVNAHDSTEGSAIPRLRIPEAMMHEQLRVARQGLLRLRRSRARCRSTSTRRRATRSSPCTGATAARSSAPCSRPTAT